MDKQQMVTMEILSNTNYGSSLANFLQDNLQNVT